MTVGTPQSLYIVTYTNPLPSNADAVELSLPFQGHVLGHLSWKQPSSLFSSVQENLSAMGPQAHPLPSCSDME